MMYIATPVFFVPPPLRVRQNAVTLPPPDGFLMPVRVRQNAVTMPAPDGFLMPLRVRHNAVTMPPPDGFLKLNTDGSSRGNPGPSSFGGLIRDGRGRWVCGYMGKMEGGSYTSLEAEVWSIYNGLRLVADKNFSRLLIETDCETVMGLVAGYYTLREDQASLKTIMDVIRKMMTERNCTLVHTRRDGNQCADLLAKLGGRQSKEFAVLERPPNVLIPYLLQDEAVKWGRHY